MTPGMNDVGAYIKPAIGLAPKANAAGSRNGSAVDRDGFYSLVISTQTGATSGTPTTLSVDVKLQDSDDGSTGWADVSGAAIAQITAADTLARKNVDLQGVKRYVRLVETVAFTGGSTPTVLAGSQVVLGGARSLPTT